MRQIYKNEFINLLRKLIFVVALFSLEIKKKLNWNQ